MSYSLTQLKLFFNFVILCWPCVSIYLFLNINQLDALNFIISLFKASTCFEHMCLKNVEAWNKLIIKFSASSWLILRNKLFFNVAFGLWWCHIMIMSLTGYQQTGISSVTQSDIDHVVNTHDWQGAKEQYICAD